jgi:hypothetical protein
MSSSTGTIVTRYETGDIIKCVPFIEKLPSGHDRIWFGSYDRKLYALDLIVNETAAPSVSVNLKCVWSHGMKGAVYASPVYDPKRNQLFVADLRGIVTAIQTSRITVDAISIRWQRQLTGTHYSI